MIHDPCLPPLFPLPGVWVVMSRSGPGPEVFRPCCLYVGVLGVLAALSWLSMVSPRPQPYDDLYIASVVKRVKFVLDGCGNWWDDMFDRIPHLSTAQTNVCI